jgi:hypothetical protein
MSRLLTILCGALLLAVPVSAGDEPKDLEAIGKLLKKEKAAEIRELDDKAIPALAAFLKKQQHIPLILPILANSKSKLARTAIEDALRTEDSTDWIYWEARALGLIKSPESKAVLLATIQRVNKRLAELGKRDSPPDEPNGMGVLFGGSTDCAHFGLIWALSRIEGKEFVKGWLEKDERGDYKLGGLLDSNEMVACIEWWRGYKKTLGKEKAELHRDAVERGLAWLVKQQRADGSFAGDKRGTLATSLTAISGLALMMEGSTAGEGKHAEPIRKAVAFLVKRAQKAGDHAGLINDPKHEGESDRYMIGHGWAMLFLASVYADEPDPARRRELKDVLTRAVKYSQDARSSNGGWFYTSAKDGHDQDEGSVTLAQIQALQATRMAGIHVPSDLLTKALECQKQQLARLEKGGRLPPGAAQSRPALYAGAVLCAFTRGDFQSDQVKRWLSACQRTMPMHDFSRRWPQDAYTLLYETQVVYALGNEGYARLFPDAAEKLQWSTYRDRLFAEVIKTQKKDGNWEADLGWGAGPLFASSVALVILQMESEFVPLLAPRLLRR